MSDQCWNMIQKMEVTTDMTFENIVVGISALLYFAVAISFAIKGNWAWFFIWLCYSGSNVGLIIVKK